VVLAEARGVLEGPQAAGQRPPLAAELALEHDERSDRAAGDDPCAAAGTAAARDHDDCR
jgi:hypothetical protein